MKYFVFIAALCSACLLAQPSRASDRLSAAEKRRAARKKRRKLEQKTLEAKGALIPDKSLRRIDSEAEGKAGKISDQKTDHGRLEQSLAKAFRGLFKLKREKVVKKDLTALAEAAERKARAEEVAQRRRNRLSRKRKIDLTFFFNW